MASKVYRRGPARPEMVMTPLIDVTFQLVVFFLLTNNIATEQAVEMRVPVLEQPRTVELGETLGKVVVNVVPREGRRSEADPLNTAGNAAYVKVGIEDYHADDLAGIQAALAQARENNPRVEVLLRADSGLYYSAVQPVMEAITAAGISRVNLVAYLPGEAPGE